jgi:hypothetical protein
MLSSATSTTWPVLKLGLTSSIPLLLERSSIRVLLDIGDSSLSCIRKCNKGARFDPARLSSLRRTFPSSEPGGVLLCLGWVRQATKTAGRWSAP